MNHLKSFKNRVLDVHGISTAHNRFGFTSFLKEAP